MKTLMFNELKPKRGVAEKSVNFGKTIMVDWYDFLIFLSKCIFAKFVDYYTYMKFTGDPCLFHPVIQSFEKPSISRVNSATESFQY